MIACLEVRARLAEADEDVLSHLERCAACAAFAEGTPLALPVPVPEVPAFNPQCLGVASAMASQRRRAWMRRARPFAAAAVVASFVTTGAFLLGGSETRRLLPGEMLVSLDGPREVLLPKDTRLVLESGRAALEQPSLEEERVRLDEGALSLSVPRLETGRVLSVQTRDALVRVRGTRFHVAVDSRGTHVSVAEGLVEVLPTGKGRDTHLLRVGEEIMVEPLDAYRVRLRTEAMDALSRGVPAAAARSLDALLATEPAAEAGAEAVALRAFVHRSAGDTKQAIELYRQSLEWLPSGSHAAWAQDACVERALLVNTPESWRECLDRFPGGLHERLIRSRMR